MSGKIKQAHFNLFKYNYSQIHLSPDIKPSSINGDRWLDQDHTERRRGVEKGNSEGVREKGGVGERSSTFSQLSLTYMETEREMTIRACESVPCRQHCLSVLVKVWFPLQG